MFDPDNYEDLREKFPTQVAEADQTSDAIEKAFSKAVSAFSHLLMQFIQRYKNMQN